MTKLSITTGRLANSATDLGEYKQSIDTAGGVAPISFRISSGQLPAGLTIRRDEDNKDTGIISGTPSLEGNYTFTIKATDSALGAARQVDEREYTIVVEASTTAKIVFAIVLSVITVIVLLTTLWVLYHVESGSAPTTTVVSWPNANNRILKPGPVAFSYDAKNSQLSYRGAMTDAAKKELLALIDGDDPAYREAITELGVASTRQSPEMVLWIFALAGLGGMTGVQIRSLFDFIGNCCYKKELDTLTWWPWYFLRPPLGFVLGIVVLALCKSDLLSLNRAHEEASLWWFAIAVLAGFGEADVIDRLRLLSKTLFGGGDSSASRQTAAPQKHAPPQVPAEPHKDEPHKDEPHKDEPHKDEPHKDEPHKDEPHKDEPHKEPPGQIPPAAKQPA